MTELLVDWCSYKAAKYAVMNWHYSKKMPEFKQVYIGVWEDKIFIGAVIFGLSVTPYLGDMFGLSNIECAELTRIALTKHKHTVSEMVVRAIRLVKNQSPGLRLFVSYADPNQNHNGAIYQAMNWLYIGTSAAKKQYYFRNQWRNDTSMYRLFARNEGWREAAEYRVLPPKHKYLFPLDKAMRRQINKLAKPYPKKCGQGVNGDALATSQRAGSIPDVRSEAKID